MRNFGSLPLLKYAEQNWRVNVKKINDKRDIMIFIERIN